MARGSSLDRGMIYMALTRYFTSMSENVITEAELALRDFSKYLDRLRASDAPYVKVKRDLMIHLIEEKIADAESVVEASQASR
jgi:hypothetical protein